MSCPYCSTKPDQSKPGKWDEVWTSKSGKKTRVSDLSENHCRNIVNLWLRNQRELGENRADSFDAFDEFPHW